MLTMIRDSIDSVDSIKTYAYGTNEEIMQKDEITQKEEIK